MIDQYLNYIQEVIQYTKEDLKDHHGIGAIIYNKDKTKILIQYHIKFKFYTIPVGKVKNGQSLIDALKTELKEECGIIPVQFKRVLTKAKTYIRNGKKIKVTRHLFDINKYRGTIKNLEPQKHKSQVFKTLSEIKRLSIISDATIDAIKYLEVL